jgi:hypothetical protein
MKGLCTFEVGVWKIHTWILIFLLKTSSRADWDISAYYDQSKLTELGGN